VYWVRHCSICHAADWAELDREIDALLAAERQRIRQLGRSSYERWLLADLLDGDHD
jgi:hypothetical protein